MATLRLDELVVSSFDTTTVDGGTDTLSIDTQQLDCWSPLCGPTAQRTCPETG